MGNLIQLRAPWTTEWKQRELESLWEQWKDCDRCGLCDTRKNVVFGEGNPNADIILIADRPGETEDGEGRPFIGRAGNLLDSLLQIVDLPREEIFITNLVGCWPPETREPTKLEMEACFDRLARIIYIIDPYIVIAAGKLALITLTRNRSLSIEKEHGKLFSSPHPSVRVKGEREGMKISGVVMPLKDDDKQMHTLEYDLVPIYHPAYIGRFDSFDEDKGTFSPGGLAHQTLDDLNAIKERVQKMKSEYEIARTQMERI